MSPKNHKSLPKGTEISGPYDTLSIWGGVMAKVDNGGYDEAGKTYFDPENLAQRHVVYLSNVPANEKFFGSRYDFKYGNKTFWEQPFYFRHGFGYTAVTQAGQFNEPFDYWVSVQLKDLGRRQMAEVVRVLRDKGYIEAAHRYPLSAVKWKNLLGMTFEETQDASSEEANAAYETVVNTFSRSIKDKPEYVWDESLGDYRKIVKEENDAAVWDFLAGVYALTKKGDKIKFIVSRKSSKQGI
jgi:hypothetical protein